MRPTGGAPRLWGHHRGLLTDFTGYLAQELKLATNTIGKDIKTLKTILQEATERGLNTNL